MKGLAEIEKAVLALSVEQRVLLAESLLRWLPPDGDQVSEAAEIAEAERRNREIETGQVQAISHEELLRRVESNRKR